MSSEKLYASNMNALLRNQSLACPSKVLEEPLWCPNSSTTHKAGVHLESVTGESNAEKDDNSDEDYDGCFQQPGKKRRLSTDQVQFLESSFEVENKLDPEKKVRIAVELGLQPRQVAIWFQNRRARFKTKQLEKDYDSLRAGYDKLKADYDTLLMDNEKMKSEIDSLKAKLLIKDSGKGNREQNFHNVGTSLLDSVSEKLNASGVPDTLAKIPVLAWKQEDASSAKSDVFDPDSPHYFNGNNSSFLEPAYSSSIFEAVNNSSFLEPAYSSNVFDSDQSDFSQDDDDNFSKSLLQLPYFPKLEDGIGDLGFPVEDQFLCFWS